MKIIKILLIPLTLLKSFFLAVTQIAWGLVSLFALNLILGYFIKEGMPLSVSETFLMLEGVIINNIISFFWVFFLLYSYFEIKEVLRK